MADTYKVLNQAFPTSGVLTPIYIVPFGKRAIVSTLSVCNQSSSNSSFRISIAVAGAADASAQYVYYDELIRAKHNFSSTQGWTLGAGDIVKALGNGALSFNLFGVESDI